MDRKLLAMYAAKVEGKPMFEAMVIVNQWELNNPEEAEIFLQTHMKLAGVASVESLIKRAERNIKIMKEGLENGDFFGEHAKIVQETLGYTKHELERYNHALAVIVEF